MILEDYIKNIKTPISILYFQGNGYWLKTLYYEPKQFKTIPKKILSMEVMDTIQEDDCLEIWVRKVVESKCK